MRGMEGMKADEPNEQYESGSQRITSMKAMEGMKADEPNEQYQSGSQ
ncbi:unnamed protein product, partial [Didymodactylos carnosus]